MLACKDLRTFERTNTEKKRFWKKIARFEVFVGLRELCTTEQSVVSIDKKGDHKNGKT